MIRDENLYSDFHEFHYVRENGRVEGLILEKDHANERTKRERPRTAKGQRRTRALTTDGVRSNNSDSDSSSRTFNVDSINEKGVNDLFSDIIYDQENEDRSDTENIVDFNRDFKRTTVDNPPQYSSDTTITRSENSPIKYSTR